MECQYGSKTFFKQESLLYQQNPYTDTQREREYTTYHSCETRADSSCEKVQITENMNSQ